MDVSMSRQGLYRARMRSRYQLARWLGPWAGENKRPPCVVRRTVPVSAERPFDLWVYRPAGVVHGALLVIPGLHFLGPADPRMDRFSRVLASAGFVVASPFLPDFMQLRLRPSLIEDAEHAYAALLEQHEVVFHGLRPGVFSISFGSLPALRIAASERFARTVGGVVLFGGFADPLEVIRFSVSGALPGHRDVPHDPLNTSVNFINFVDSLPHLEASEQNALRDAWMRFILATWGQVRYRTGGDAHHTVAHAIAETLPPPLRTLYLQGLGVEPGGLEIIDDVLAQQADALGYLDPRQHLHTVQAPVTVIHGRDDDVIPFTQAEKLATSFPPGHPVQLCLTGLYEHSHQGGGGATLLTDLPLLVKELTTMARMLEGIVDAATQVEER